MAESEISYFEFLKNFIDIRRMAFSTRGTRLVIMENDEGVLIRQSERPGKAMTERGGVQIKTPLLEGLSFTDGNGKPLDVRSQPTRTGWILPLVGPYLIDFRRPGDHPDEAAGSGLRGAFSDQHALWRRGSTRRYILECTGRTVAHSLHHQPENHRKIRRNNKRTAAGRLA